jgi:uncharacterized protein (TIGR03437 family)
MFTLRQVTRIVDYCHIPLSPGTEAGYLGCTGPGIAYIDTPSHLSYQAIQSFLANTNGWQAVGNPPSQDPYLSGYGGLFLAVKNTQDQFFDNVTSVQVGSNLLASGPSNPVTSVFYDDWLLSGAYSVSLTSPTGGKITGNATGISGGFRATFLKEGPLVFGVQSALNTGLSGLTVASGSTITISGSGFDSTSIVNVGNLRLSTSSISSQQITAYLPPLVAGLFPLQVITNSGQSSINILTAPPALPPAIALNPAQLKFSYVVGGTAPASQSVSVSNSGGGAFTWSATPNAAWLALTSSPGLLTVSINLAGLSANTYTGMITITGVGASNNPQTVSVTLIVAAATTPNPTISLSAVQANFAYIVGSAVPTPQTISISNSGGGTLAWSASSNASWLSVTSSGTAPSTLSISANPSGLNVGSYNGAITLTATGATNSPQTITAVLSITAASSTIAVTSVTNAASSSPGAIAAGEIIAIKGSGLGPATGVSFSVDPSTSMVDTSLAGTVVLFGGIPAPILYTSAGQVNAIVPYEVAGRSQVVVQVQYQGGSSAGTTLPLPVATAAPGLFTFNSTGTGPAAAVNQDGSLNGPSNPAAGGSYVTLYFTGGGQTNPAGLTGSISGSVLKWLIQSVTVTVGGQPATVAFDGAAPTFIDGFLQLDIGVPSGVHGTVSVVVRVAGIASPATAMFAVQ